jgi:hypothetical protein
MRPFKARKPVLVGPAAGILLGAMLLVMGRSVQDDALTMDEPVHITAGYTALRFRSARLNPEHPPLLKLLASLPLLPLSLQFPLTHPAWQEPIDGPWKAAYEEEIAGVFLYDVGNDPHQIAAWARLSVSLWRWAACSLAGHGAGPEPALRCWRSWAIRVRPPSLPMVGWSRRMWPRPSG